MEQQDEREVLTAMLFYDRLPVGCLLYGATSTPPAEATEIINKDQEIHCTHNTHMPNSTSINRRHEISAP